MIRSFIPQDLNRIMELWLNTNITAHSFISRRYWEDNYAAVKAMMPSADIYIYEEAHSIQGFIAGIFVSDEMQSKGLGKSLLDYVKNRNNTLALHVYKKNERAVKFYLREGFVITQEQLDENIGEAELLLNWKA